MIPVLYACALLGGSPVGAITDVPDTVGHPQVTSITPRGGQRGSVVTLTISGSRLRTFAGLALFRSGIEVIDCNAESDKLAKARIRLAPNCPLGVHQILVRTELGFSKLKLFMVGTLPETTEKEPNNDRDRAQIIPLDITVNGRITAEDTDVFAISVTKGQRVNFEVEGLRLGDLEFDPHLTIHDDRGRRLAMVDDTIFGRMDPLASVVADRDGTCFVSLRESSRGGSNASFYRLHVGRFPRPTVAFPAGGPAGSNLGTRLVGSAGEFETSIPLPRRAGPHKHFVTTARGTSPTPIQVVAMDAPNVFEPDEGGGASSGTSLSDWQMIGPFENPLDKSGRSLGHQTVHPPERRIVTGEALDFAGAHPGRDGDVSWKRQSRLRPNAVYDLRRMIPRTDHSVVYLARTLDAPTARRVLCLISADDTLRVYQGRKLVLDDAKPSPATTNQHRLLLDLEKGRNELLVKISNRSGRLAFFCRILDPLRFEKYGTVTVPSALNGRIREPGEKDRFAFLARKGEQIEFRAICRGLRSPLDPAVDCYCSHDRFYAGNDDSGGLDSLLRFRAPFTGEFIFTVRDMLMNAGPDYVYRVEVTQPRSRPLITRATLPGFATEWTLAVPTGGRNAILLNATNLDQRAGVRLALQNLPSGVTATIPVFSPGTTSVPVVIRADKDLPSSAHLLDVTATATEKALDLRTSRFRQSVVVVEARNRRPYLSTTVDRLPLAISKAAPFAIDASSVKVPLVRNSPLRIPFKISRAPDYSGSIRVRILANPTGVSSNQVTVRPGRDEGSLTLNASGNAPVGSKPIVLIASGDVDGAPISASSEILDLSISVPWLEVTVGSIRCERGGKTELAISLKHNKKFEGPIDAQWIGLPRGVICAPVPLTPDTERISVPLSIDAKAPVGRHRSFRLRLRIRSPEGWIVQDFRQGEIRIDRKRSGT